MLAHPIYAQATQTIESTLSQIQTKAVVGNEADKRSLRVILAKFTSLKGNFAQNIYDMQGQELQSATGTLLLQKPQQLRWSIVSPDESLLIADGKAVYNVDPFLEQVTIMDQTSLTKSNPLMLLISDDPKQWEQVGVIKEGSNYTIISLSSDSPITKLVLGFNENNVLSSLLSYDRQQQQNSLAFSDVVLDSGVNKQDFMFKANNAWIVDDQRVSQ
jgi:outer membrane lipoprotein carrier protein